MGAKMICDTCKHAHPHPSRIFLVCKHPRTMAMQDKTNGADTGIHCEIVFDHWCGGRLREVR